MPRAKKNVDDGVAGDGAPLDGWHLAEDLAALSGLLFATTGRAEGEEESADEAAKSLALRYLTVVDLISESSKRARVIAKSAETERDRTDEDPVAERLAQLEAELIEVGVTSAANSEFVEGLGTYMELEVVLEPGQSIDDGVQVARALQTALGVRDEDRIDVAYVDLLEARG